MRSGPQLVACTRDGGQMYFNERAGKKTRKGCTKVPLWKDGGIRTRACTRTWDETAILSNSERAGLGSGFACLGE